MNWVWVALGGAAGAMARYGFALLSASAGGRYPLASLGVNWIGCALAGFLVTWVLQRGTAGTGFYLFAMTGFLGGFTTFSAFSVEVMRLVQQSAIGLAIMHAALNLFGSLAFVFVGAWCARRILDPVVAGQ